MRYPWSSRSLIDSLFCIDVFVQKSGNFLWFISTRIETDLDSPSGILSQTVYGSLQVQQAQNNTGGNKNLELCILLSGPFYELFRGFDKIILNFLEITRNWKKSLSVFHGYRLKPI